MQRTAVYLDLSTPLFEKDTDLSSYKVLVDELSRVLLKSLNIKLYISVTLETLNLISSSGQIFYSLKSLMNHERVQFVIKSNFENPTQLLNSSCLEVNCILNEYLIGSLFGNLNTFEGDKAIVIKDLVSFSPFKNIMSFNDISLLNEYGYTTFILEESIIESSCIVGNNFLIKAITNTSALFENYLNLDSLGKWLELNIKGTYEVIYLPLYDLFKLYPNTAKVNLFNLIHLLDHSDKIVFSFVDETFSLPIYRNFQEVIKEIDILNYFQTNFKLDSDLFEIQKDLEKFLKPSFIDNLESMVSTTEEYKNIPLWQGTGNKLVDEYLRFTYLMLTLLSFSIHGKLSLLNKGFSTYLTGIINELKVYSEDNPEFKTTLERFNSYINQKSLS
jgi:hypothetical protein